jgi:cytochrome P450
MHDPTIYPKPFAFSPERFLPKEEGLKLNLPKCPEIQPDPRVFAFGFGRRTCPGSYTHAPVKHDAYSDRILHSGLHFAETSMVLTLASILARFDISLPPNTPDLPPVEFTTGITRSVV